MTEFRMPSLGSDMEEGTLAVWRKHPGEPIRRGDVIAEVETDKGLIEVECFTSGVLERTLIEEGERAAVGAPIAVIAVDAAAEGGEAPAAPAPAAGEPVTFDEDKMRRAIAAAMARSKREIPHFYLSSEIDLGPALEWLAHANESRGIESRILPAALLFKAAAVALRKVPELNGRFEGEQVILAADVHVGLAISLRGGGLVAPAIRHADRLDLDALMQAMKDAVERARAGKLRSSEMTDATVTVTSLGERGADLVFPVIVPPQIAIIGFGRIIERPWVVDGHVVARPVVTATLAADHRATDGHRAGLFLAEVASRLVHPEVLAQP